MMENTNPVMCVRCAPLVRTFHVYGPPIDRVQQVGNSKHLCLARAVRASLFVSPQTTPTRWAILSPFG